MTIKFPGFKREQLRSRYDVDQIAEDEWHSYSELKTAKVLSDHLFELTSSQSWLLNAGAGVYSRAPAWCNEVSLDLFVSPILPKPNPVCGSVEHLPFDSATFEGIVCVGEVLGYCDPTLAIREFSRVITKGGILICDFGSSRSPKLWFKESYGRAADIFTDRYNGSTEHTWVYDPDYVANILDNHSFRIKKRLGTHTWSAVARRMGFSAPIAITVQRHLDYVRAPSRWADLTTIVAVKA